VCDAVGIKIPHPRPRRAHTYDVKTRRPKGQELVFEEEPQAKICRREMDQTDRWKSVGDTAPGVASRLKRVRRDGGAVPARPNRFSP
jgi:hypothetical protein